MTVERAIVAEFAARLSVPISDGAIRVLEASPGSGLPGDDPGLATLWEEVVVQVRGEESIFWDHYKDLISQTLRGQLLGCSAVERLALWLGSSGAEIWHLYDETASKRVDDVPVNDEGIAERLLGDVFKRAHEFHSPNVDTFLDFGAGRD